MKPLELLGIAVLVFTTVKVSFAVLQWVLEDKADPILRGSLDRIYDHLDKLTFRQLSARILFRTINGLSDRFLRPNRKKWNLVALFFMLNIAAYIVAQSTYCYMRNECGNTLGHDTVLKDYGLVRLLIWSILSFSASTLIQLACISLVWLLMKLAAERLTAYRIALCLTVSLLMLPTIFLTQYFIQQSARLIAFNLPVRLEYLWVSLTSVTPYFWATLILALVTALPIVIYLSVLLASVLVRASPSFVRSALLWIVFKITTDNTPVLERFGSAAGGVASLSSAVAGYLRT